MRAYVDNSLLGRLNILNIQQEQHILGDLARPQTKLLLPDCLLMCTREKSTSHRHTSQRLSPSPLLLELLGTRCGSPRTDYCAAVCTSESKTARQQSARALSGVPADGIELQRNGKSIGKGRAHPRRKGVISQGKGCGAPERRPMWTRARW